MARPEAGGEAGWWRSTPTFVPLLFTSVAISGGNTGDYSQTNNCFPSVAVGGSCTIMVSNTPSVTGPNSSSVVMTTNATGSPQMVTLSGTGQ